MHFVNEIEAPALDDTVWAVTPEDCAAQRMSANGWLVHVRNLLTPQQVLALRDAADSGPGVAVGHDGVLAHYQVGQPIGSYRTSIFWTSLAQALWSKLSQSLGSQQPTSFPAQFGPNGHADWDGRERWIADGVNPLMRFIRYLPGEGQLVAHYDGPYVQTPQRRTLFSFILYLSDNEHGGQTRFLRDAQDALEFDKRNFSDKATVAASDEVQLAIQPRAGDALVFEHRMLHDGAPLAGLQDKLVMRTDVFCSCG